MPLFASFVALSGRILRGNGKAPEWVSDVIGTSLEVGQAFSDSVSAEGIPAVTYSVTSGSLPNGLTLNSSTGAISGTPSAGGNFNFTITASNAVGSVSTAYTRSVLFPLPTTINYLVVAGGGGGASGGGGAGGMITGNLTPVQNTSYSVSVGGAGGNSSGFGTSCTRGGGGGNAGGGNGGSGGGGGFYYGGGAGISGQGNNGGGGGDGNTSSGGGGGKSAEGRHGASGGGSGSGGAGQSWNGKEYSRGGGGYHGTRSTGGANSGHGGNAYSGAGAQSGRVAFSVATDSRTPTISAGLSYTTATSGSNTIYYFNSGSGNVTWS